MRRASMMSATLAACLLASATAAPGKEHYFTITLTEARIDSVAKVDSFAVKQGVKPMQYKLDRVMVKSWSTSGGAPPPGFPGGVTVASGDVNGAAPTRLLGANRLVVVTAATGGCTVGKRYPAATVAGGGKRYQLTDVTITGCERDGPQEKITFVYGTLDVE